jgi:hypothetical protein
MSDEHVDVLIVGAGISGGQGSKDPWRRQQNYLRNRNSTRRAPVADAPLEFARAASTPDATAQSAA